MENWRIRFLMSRTGYRFVIFHYWVLIFHYSIFAIFVFSLAHSLLSVFFRYFFITEVLLVFQNIVFGFGNISFERNLWGNVYGYNFQNFRLTNEWLANQPPIVDTLGFRVFKLPTSLHEFHHYTLLCFFKFVSRANN